MILGSKEWLDLYYRTMILVEFIDNELGRWWAILEYAKLGEQN